MANRPSFRGPTVLILASWCFTRSCPWLEERLFRLRVLQPYVRIVRGEEPLSPRARIVSAVLMWTAITVSLAVLRASGGPAPWTAAVLIGAGLAGSVAIARFRRVPAPARAWPSEASAQREEDRIGVLIGLLKATPQALWRIPGVLETVDEFGKGDVTWHFDQTDMAKAKKILGI